MKPLLCLLLFPAFTATLHAQSSAPAAPAPAAVVDPVRAKAAAKQIEASQRKLDSLTADLRKIDDRIESKITKAVDQLTVVTDSRDSGTRVADAKANVIDFLRKQITDYSQRRSQIRAQLDNRQRVIPAAVLQSDLAKIDARLDHRIAQVTALGGSFARHEDYDKYEVAGTGWYGHTEYRLNDDWKANRRATLKAAQAKGKLGDAITDSIRRLTSTNRFKQSQIAGASPESARLLQADIARNERLIASLESSRDFLNNPDAKPMKPLGSLEAKSITDRLKKAATTVRADQYKLTGAYNTLNQARAQHAALVRAQGAKP